MFEINATYLIFIASFVLFIMALNQVMLKPVGHVLELRAARIAGDIEEGKSARAQAGQVLDEFEQQLHKTRRQAQAIINEAIEKASYHRNVELNRLKDEGRKQMQAVRAEIAGQRAGLMQALVKQEQELVAQILTRLTGEPAGCLLSDDKIRHALEEAC